MRGEKGGEDGWMVWGLEIEGLVDESGEGGGGGYWLFHFQEEK